MFTRQATGVVREISPVDALMIATGIIVGFGWIPTFAAMWYLFPGVNMPVNLIIIAVLSTINGLYYVLITTLMPRSGGGGYVPLSRILHPVLGIGMSYLFVLASIVNLAYEGNWLTSVALVPQLGAYGAISGNSVIQNLATLLATPTWSFAIGTVFLVLTGIVVLLGGRFVKQVVRVAFFLGLIGAVLILVLLATTTQAQFQIDFNSFAGSGAYQQVISASRNLGWSLPSNWITPTIIALPFGFFLTIGFAWNTYFSGEIKKVSRAMMMSVLGSLVFFAVFFSLLAILMQRTFGIDFITGAGYLFNAHPANYTLSFPPWPTAFISLVNSNPLVSAFLVIAVICWGIIVTIAFYYFISRIILAWSFDRAIPSSFGSVNERFHTPVVAIVLTGFLAWIVLIFITFLPTVLGPVNLTYLYVVAVSLDGLAGIALVWRKRQLLEAAPNLVKKKVLGIPIISILGAYSVIFLLALFGLTLTIPATAGPLGATTAGLIAITIIFGVVIYYAMKTFLKSRGIDLSLAYKEIPPE